MAASKMTFQAALDTLNDLQKEKDEYGQALSALRSKTNWRPGIDSDGRASVKNLYALYVKKEEEIKELLSYSVVKGSKENVKESSKA